MLEWRKQILRKNRYNQQSICDNSNYSDDSHLYVYIDQMKTYLLKLFSYLIRTKTMEQQKSRTLSSNLFQIPDLNIPSNMTDKQHLKLLAMLYRRLKAMLASFQYSYYLDKDFDNIYNHIKNSSFPSISTFFGLCCYRIIEQINEIDNQKQNIKNGCTEILKLERELKKESHKQISDQICLSIYEILELEKIQASYMFIQGLDINNNINFVYDRQKLKNKKTKKQYNQYLIKYQNRDKQKNQRIKLSSVMVKKSYSGSTFWKNGSVIKGSQNLTKVVSRSQSQNKSLLKRDSLVQKDRVRLQPLMKPKAKLKLLKLK